MTMSSDVWNCCRTCMNTRSLVPIVENIESNQEFLDILNQTTGLKVNLNDNLPQKICQLCLDTVKKFDSFRNTCLSIHMKLQSLNQHRHEPNSFNTECKSDDDKISSNQSQLEHSIKESKYQTEGHIEIETTIEDLLKSRKPFTFINLRPFSKTLSNNKSKHTTNEVHKNDTLHAKIEGIIKGERDNEGVLINEALSEKHKISSLEVNIKVESVAEEQSSYECSVCQKVYRNLVSYERHAKLHTLVKDVICEHCGKSFYFKNKLLKHCRSKHGYKKILKCSYCDFLGANTTTVKIHERLHTGERPYVCDVCSARFHRKSTYLQHRAIHLPEKTVQCESCPARFKSLTLMRIHRNRSHRPRQYKFHCRLCTSTYERRYDCVKHLRRVHGIAETLIDSNLERVKLSDLCDN